MEEQGSMHQGRVLVALALGKQPGKPGVQVLIMAQDALAEVGESADGSQEDDEEEEEHFPGERREKGEDGPVEPGSVVGFSCGDGHAAAPVSGKNDGRILQLSQDDKR